MPKVSDWPARSGELDPATLELLAQNLATIVQRVAEILSIDRAEVDGSNPMPRLQSVEEEDAEAGAGLPPNGGHAA